MDNNTKQLIEALAAKLGTTTEYLWGVLIKQAPIDSTINVIVYGIMLSFAIFWIKQFKKFTKAETSRNYSDKWEEWQVGSLLASGIIGAFITIFFVALTLTSTITGFLNPEYWALQQILNKI